MASLQLPREDQAGGDVLTLLEETAERGDAGAFNEVLRTVDWHSRAAEDFIRVTQLALEAGAHLAARRISAEGARLHPDHAELQKYARVLAPPKLISSTLPASKSVEANRKWIESHGKEYRGQWVALRDGQFLGASESLSELRKNVDTRRDVMLTIAY